MFMSDGAVGQPGAVSTGGGSVAAGLIRFPLRVEGQRAGHRRRTALVDRSASGKLTE